MFIHYVGSLVEDELTRCERTVSELKCDVDKRSYFELVDTPFITIYILVKVIRDNLRALNHPFINSIAYLLCQSHLY